MQNSRPKKILIFTTVYYPRFIGGAEIAVKEITDRISPSDVEFHMITLRAHKDLPKIEKMGNVLVHRAGFSNDKKNKSRSAKILHKFNKFYFPISSSRLARKLHKKYKYDAVWSIMASYAGFGASRFKHEHPEVPFILTLQEGDPLDSIEKKVGVFKEMFRNIFLRADKIQAISNFLGDWARSLGYEKNISIIPNAVDIKKFTENFSPERLALLEEKLGKQVGDFYLITTSRLVKKNAVDVVIKSLQFLPENIKFLILGEGEDKDMLVALTHDLKLEDRVFFLGYVPHDDMPRYLKISDIFVRPSRSEGLGNSFLEAMAAGLPVIATKVGGIPDFLRDGENGLYTNVDDPEDLAKKVLEIVKNPELMYKIIENGRRMVEREYNWEKITERMEREVFGLVGSEQ